MRKNTIISLTATLVAANISFAVPAFADDLQTYNLDTMVVTAQRESKRDVDTPASVTTVSQKQLVETGASNLFDALRLQSGVTTYSYGGSQSLGGMNAKILMRGANKGTVVMIDGVPANINETYYLDSIPVESIARVEIVKGAASTLYGSEASTGVINIITKKKMANTLSLTKGEYGKAKEALTLNAGKLNLGVALEQSDPLKVAAAVGIGGYTALHTQSVKKVARTSLHKLLLRKRCNRSRRINVTLAFTLSGNNHCIKIIGHQLLGKRRSCNTETGSCKRSYQRNFSTLSHLFSSSYIHKKYLPNINL